MKIELSLLLEQVYLLSQNAYIHALLWMVVVDIASGFIKAYRNNCLNSSIARKGILSHLMLVASLLIATPYLKLLNMTPFANALILFYVGSYTISFLENLHEIGIPIPKFLREKLERLKGE